MLCYFTERDGKSNKRQRQSVRLRPGAGCFIIKMESLIRLKRHMEQRTWESWLNHIL